MSIPKFFFLYFCVPKSTEKVADHVSHAPTPLWGQSLCVFVTTSPGAVGPWSGAYWKYWNTENTYWKSCPVMENVHVEEAGYNQLNRKNSTAACRLTCLFGKTVLFTLFLFCFVSSQKWPSLKMAKAFVNVSCLN